MTRALLALPWGQREGCAFVLRSSVLVSFRFGYFGKEKLKEIKLLVCNIDGCLTNGHIYVSGDQKEIISYDVKDAIGISLLKKSGIEVCDPWM